jgi:competence protein ComEA
MLIERNFMKHHHIWIALCASALILSANLAGAFENSVAAEREAASKSKASSHVAQSPVQTRRRAAARAKPVNINSATSKQLMTLPGVSDAVAKKIVAGRPYASNSDLLTRNVINKEIYDNIKRRIFVMPGGRAAVKTVPPNKQN